MARSPSQLAETLGGLGRLTELRNLSTVADARRELFEAMAAIAETGSAPGAQKPSIGCNIKWKPGNEPDWFV